MSEQLLPAPATRAALRELLLALADDEFITGFNNSEWTGIAPLLEEDLAFSSLAQDELGHARLLYGLLAELEGISADALAYGREPAGFRHAQLVEQRPGDWAYSVSRQLLYDTADAVRLEALRASSYQPLASAATSMLREERYHLLHAQTWLRHLAGGGDEARRRQQAAFAALWPEALGLFEPLESEGELVSAGVLPLSFAELQQRWVELLAPGMREHRLPLPFVSSEGRWVATIEPRYGGRRGQHGAPFAELYEQFTSVYRLDPGARW